MRKVPINKDFETILICAVRYALGRQSYMPSLVIGYITPLLPQLSDWALAVMEDDLTDPVGGYGDPKIDEPGWIAFLIKIKNERKKRNDKTR